MVSVAAYLDGYSQALEPNWPSPEHVGTWEYELGYDDGEERRLGNEVPRFFSEAVEARLFEMADAAPADAPSLMGLVFA